MADPSEPLNNTAPEPKPERSLPPPLPRRTPGARHTASVAPAAPPPAGARVQAAPPPLPRRGPTQGPTTPVDVAATPLTTRSGVTLLVSGYEAELAGTSDPARRCRILCELGRLASDQSSDDNRAAAYYQRALQELEGHTPAMHGLRRCLLRLGRDVDALTLFDAELEALSDTGAKAVLQYHKGVLLEDRLRRPEPALRAFEAAVDLDPSFAPAWPAVCDLAMKLGHYRRAEAALAATANLANAEPERRSSLLTKRAQILEFHLGEPERALEAHQAALALDADNELSRLALQRLFYDKKRYQDLAELLRRQPEGGSSQQQLRNLMLAAALLEHRLQRGPEALAALQAAQCHGADDPLLQLALCDALEQAGEKDALADALQQRIDGSSDSYEQLALLKTLGKLYDQDAGDPDLALAVYETALALAPTDHGVIGALEGLYMARDDHESLLRLLSQQIENEHALSVRVDLLTRKARLLKRVDRPGEAAAMLQEALCLEPSNVDVFRALEAVYMEGTSPTQLRSLYRQRLDQQSTGTGEQVSLLLKIARLEEGVLDTPELAAHSYRQVLRLQPDHGPALSSLQHVTARAGLHGQLVEALELEVEQTKERSTRAALLCRAAQVLIENQADRQGALTRLKRALEFDKKHVPSLLAMERVLRAEGRYEELLQILVRRLDLTSSTSGQCALLLHISAICVEHLSDPGRALKYARRAVKVCPADDGARRTLAELLREQDDHKGLAEALENELSSIAEERKKALGAYRIGELYELRIGDPQRALHHYSVALGYAPDLQAAFDASVRVRLALGEHRTVADDVQVRADASTATDERRRLQLWAAELRGRDGAEPENAKLALNAITAAEKLKESHGLTLRKLDLQRQLDDTAGVATTLQALAQTASGDVERRTALHALLRLSMAEMTTDEGAKQQVNSILGDLRDLGLKDSELVETSLELQLGEDAAGRAFLQIPDDIMGDPSLAAVQLCRKAEALADEKPDLAAETYRRAVARDPQCLGAVRGLGRLALKSNDRPMLYEAVREESRVGGHRELSARYLERAAALELANEDREAAAQALQQALEQCPDSADVADRLVTLLEEDGQILRMVDVLRRTAESARTPERRRDLWLKMSTVQSDPLENLAGSLAAAQKATAADPKHLPASLKLAQLYRRHRRWDDAVKLLKASLATADDGQQVGADLRNAHFELATIYEEDLDDADNAIASLQAADKAGPPSSRVIRRLCKLQSQKGDHEQAMANAKRLVDCADDDEHRAAALAMSGKAQLAAGDQRAAETMAQSLALSGPNTGAGHSLKGLIDRGEAPAELYAEAIGTYARRSAGAEREGALLDLATFLDRVQDDPSASADILNQHMQDGSAAMHLALARYLHRANRDVEAAAILRRLATQSPGEADYQRLLVEVETAMHRPEQAAAAAEVLVVLGAASPQHKQLLLTEQDREATGTLPQVTLDALEPLVCDKKRGYLLEQLIRTLQPAVLRLFPRDLSAYQVRPEDRLDEDTEHPLSVLARSLGRRLRAPGLELYVHHSRTHGVVLEPGNPGAILVPAQLLEMPQAQQRYLLARPLLANSLGIATMLKLTPRELQIFLSAACRQVSKSFGAGLTSEEVLTQQARQIQKSLSRRERKAMEPLAQRYIELGAHDLERWVGRRKRRLNQVAALTAGNLPLVVQCIAGEQKELRALNGPALAKASPEIRELLGFWNSEAAATVRLQLKVS